jgi:uncharacterized membrane protein YqiK
MCVCVCVAEAAEAARTEAEAEAAEAEAEAEAGAEAEAEAEAAEAGEVTSIESSNTALKKNDRIGAVSAVSQYMVYNCVYYCDTLCLLL